MKETLMTPDMCMKFLIWSYYYYDIIPTSDFDFAECEKLSSELVLRLNNIKDMMLRCFTEDSVLRAVEQLRKAKMQNEVCPYSKIELDAIFLS